MNERDRDRYYEDFVKPLLTEPRPATAPKPQPYRRGTAFAGTMVIIALVLGGGLGWWTSSVYSRHKGYSDEAVLQYKAIIRQLDADLQSLREEITRLRQDGSESSQSSQD